MKKFDAKLEAERVIEFIRDYYNKSGEVVRKDWFSPSGEFIKTTYYNSNNAQNRKELDYFSSSLY